MKIEVVKASQMIEIEKKVFKEKKDVLAAIEKVAKEISKKIKKIAMKITLLVGKGNNGQDAIQTGILLLEENFSVKAFLFFEDMKDSLKQKIDLFKRKGGKVFFIKEEKDIFFEKKDLILDGIFGIGFKGPLDEKMVSFIKKINSFPNIKIAIDIPSGLNGDTGEVFQNAIKADETYFISFAKTGFFLNQGWNFVGSLQKIDIGFDKNLIKPDFFMLETIFPIKLPEIKKIRNKYEAGFVIGISGSSTMQGAANLSGFAALKSGAGIVKLFLNTEEKSFFLKDELIKDSIYSYSIKELLTIFSKASSIFIGPGLGRDKKIEKILLQIISKINIPLVLDADALFFLSLHLDCKLPKNTILTPHRKEMLRLLQKEKLSDEDLLLSTQKFADNKGVIIVLKGAVTFIFHPQKKTLVIPKGPAALATAGTGDVLTGIISSFLSQKLSSYTSAILGVYVHCLAGKIAAKEKTDYSLVASDVIDFLPEAFKEIKKENII